MPHHEPIRGSIDFLKKIGSIEDFRMLRIIINNIEVMPAKPMPIPINPASFGESKAA
jgi:hypothetical protein